MPGWVYIGSKAFLSTLNSTNLFFAWKVYTWVVLKEKGCEVKFWFIKLHPYLKENRCLKRFKTSTIGHGVFNWKVLWQFLKDKLEQPYFQREKYVHTEYIYFADFYEYPPYFFA